MTENGVERAFRDSRIYLIVEGANEVMQSFIFAYGGKQLAEQMLNVQNALLWDSDQGVGKNLGRMLGNAVRPVVLGKAIPLGVQLVLGIRPGKPDLKGFHPTLAPQVKRLATLIRNHSYAFKRASMREQEAIVTRQTIQARIADSAMYLYAMICVLSKLTHQLNRGDSGLALDRDREAALHFFDFAEIAIEESLRKLTRHADVSMREAASAAMAYNDALPNERFIIPERSPVAAA